MSFPHLVATFLLVAACASPRPADTTAAPQPASAGTVIYVMRLEHVQADEIAPRIHELLNSAATGRSTADVVRIASAPTQNALVLSGTPARIQEAREAVARLDVAVDPATRR